MHTFLPRGPGTRPLVACDQPQATSPMPGLPCMQFSSGRNSLKVRQNLLPSAIFHLRPGSMPPSSYQFASGCQKNLRDGDDPDPEARLRRSYHLPSRIWSLFDKPLYSLEPTRPIIDPSNP
ncbi:hypothetical protein SLE2022_269340 [Rubroshorea leprosula]